MNKEKALKNQGLEFREDISVVGGDDRQVSQSGKPLCTGASLWAVPKLARGLRPLEPRHVNGVSIPTEHLLID